MEILDNITNTIQSILERNLVSEKEVNNIMELIKIHGTINYNNGAIEQLKSVINEK
jgi:hypothetical protein